MSIATIGAVAATETELLIPGVPQIPYALLLSGAGGTTEVIEVRSLQRGGHVYVTRGAFGSLPVAHTAPVVVTLYDPNSGGGGGGGVTVDNGTDPPTSVTTVVAPGASITGDSSDLSGMTKLIDVADGDFQISADDGSDPPGNHVFIPLHLTSEQITFKLSEWFFTTFLVALDQGAPFSYILRVGQDGASVEMAPTGGKVGFFGTAAIAQPAAPVTLGDVIAALKALGLVAS